MSQSSDFFIVAAESSGDQLGAYLIEAIQERSKAAINIDGIGGPKMADLGVSNPIDIRPLAVVGPLDGLLAYRKVLQLVEQTKQQIIKANPKVVILIDSWGFTIRVAKEIRKSLPECKLVKYVAPQVFASRPGRAKLTAQIYDHLLTIHSFDSRFFEAEGLATTFVGNPALFKPTKTGSRSFVKKYNLEEKQVLSVFFGSRPAEIKQLYKPFLGALDIVKADYPKLKIISPLSDNVSTMIRELAIEDRRLQDIILLSEDEKNDVFEVSDLALACSGTITLELANAGVPTIVGYRLAGALGYPIQKLLFKAPFASLINLAAGEALFPEYLTKDCTDSNLARSLIEFLQKEDLRKETQIKLQETVLVMRGKSASPSQIAADTVLSLLN